jgi:hypothetical protein
MRIGEISLTCKRAGSSVTDLVLAGMAGMLNDPGIAAKLVAEKPDIAAAIVAGMAKDSAKLVAENPDIAVAMVAGMVKDPAKFVSENPDIAVAMVTGMVKDPAKFVSENPDLAAKLLAAEAPNLVVKLAAKHVEFADFAAMSVVVMVLFVVLGEMFTVMTAMLSTKMWNHLLKQPDFCANHCVQWRIFSLHGSSVEIVLSVLATLSWVVANVVLMWCAVKCAWVVYRLPPFWRVGTLIGLVCVACCSGYYLGVQMTRQMYQESPNFAFSRLSLALDTPVPKCVCSK